MQIVDNARPIEEGGAKVAMAITCDCGYVVRAGTEADVMAQAREHIRTDHPDLTDRVSDDDLRAMIEEA